MAKAFPDEFRRGVVAHPRSANNTIAVRVAEPSDPVTTLMFSELNGAAHSVQSALLASMNSVTSQHFCRPPMLIGCS
jgi:hypothetical protein